MNNRIGCAISFASSACSFAGIGAYDQVDVKGFIKLNALRLGLGAMAGRTGGAL
jgi:hypothetical protein